MPEQAPPSPAAAPKPPPPVAPITQAPPAPGRERLWHGLAAARPPLLDRLHFFGALSANPFWHGASAMRLATWLHVRRGGKVLGLFWHSSQMLPGGSPHVPDKAAAEAAPAKIFRFCRWLRRTFTVEGVTRPGLGALAPEPHFPRRGELAHSGRDDW